ncbi:hypothetical protein T459_02300 [Capsicum annuum]|uniref:Serine aminopeptidase S33 domain-containing protein n=1 Tax=Capsicum annuum TaxID=4072 RepID=A0A2G3AJQ4_CAPAN|nr:hypothetical protein T459_02300 [Capsicum annuum]
MEENQTKSPQQPLLHYWGNTPEQEYYNLQGIKSTKSFFTSPRGLKLFTRSWVPSTPTPPHGVIFMIHGYGNDISWTFQATPIHLAKNGFACFALDLEGHGQSQGKMTIESQMMDATTSMGANNITTSSRTNAPPTMAPAKKPEKFSGIDFKR